MAKPNPAPPTWVVVELAGTHTHRGVDCGAGDKITVTERQGERLAALGHTILGPGKNPHEAGPDATH